MKSNIQFILSMIIFGTIGLVQRYIDLSSSETALLSSSIGCLFLMFVFFMMKKSISWKLLKTNASILFLSGIALGGNWIFLYQSYDYTTITKNKHPIELLSKAISLEDKSIYLTIKPIVPKIIIDKTNCILYFTASTYLTHRQFDQTILDYLALFYLSA